MIAKVFKEQLRYELETEGSVTLEEMASRRSVDKKRLTTAVHSLVSEGELRAILTKDDTLLSLSYVKETLYSAIMKSNDECEDMADGMGLDDKETCCLLLTTIIERLAEPAG